MWGFSVLGVGVHSTSNWSSLKSKGKCLKRTSFLIESIHDHLLLMLPRKCISITYAVEQMLNSERFAAATNGLVPLRGQSRTAHFVRGRL